MFGMVRGLALNPRKDVFVFVHGYRNSSEDAVFAMAELWHFLAAKVGPWSIAGRLVIQACSAIPTTGIERFHGASSEADVALSDRITIINFIGKSDRFGHSYFRTNPAVSSDLMLLLRYDYQPGSPERPLEHLGNAFWRIPDGYPGPVATQ